MIESVWQYARERLQASGEFDQLRDRHLDYFLALAGQAQPALEGPKAPEWIARLSADHLNIRLALEWSLQSPTNGQKGPRMLAALTRYAEIDGKLEEIRKLLVELLTASTIPYTIVRATQFFEFVGGIAHADTNRQTIRLSTALLQPIASQDAARAVSDAALADPVNSIVGVAGPDKIGLDDLVRRFLKKTNAPQEVVSGPKAPYFGVEINDRSLTRGEAPASPRLISTTG